MRNSKTLHERLLYVAVPIASGGKVHGAVRITHPFSAVDARILRYWLILALIGVVVLAGAAVVGLGLARFVTRPLHRLEEAAAAVGEGDLEARAPEREGPPEVRSLAAAFNETVAKLSRLLRSQGEFVADASHELRTPLTALRLRLESLPSSRDRDAALHEADRLRDLVDGLLTLARADAGSEASARVDATALMRERVEAWLPLADEHGVALVAQLDGPLPVRAAPGRLAQVLDNLLANALEASPAGGTVTVSARRSVALGRAAPLRRGPRPHARSSASGRSTASGAPGPERAARGSGSRSSSGSSPPTRARSSSPRRRAAASTPWSACVLPEPLPKLARALARRLPAEAVERRHERKAPHTRTGSRSHCDRHHRRRRHRRARPSARSAGGSRRSGAARTRARHAVVGRGR